MVSVAALAGIDYPTDIIKYKLALKSDVSSATGAVSTADRAFTTNLTTIVSNAFVAADGVVLSNAYARSTAVSNAVVALISSGESSSNFFSTLFNYAIPFGDMAGANTSYYSSNLLITVYAADGVVQSNAYSRTTALSNAVAPGAEAGLIAYGFYTNIQYPVFNIPLDSWSEVELKASTNNFNPALTNELERLAYWYESLGSVALTSWYGFAHADINAQLFFCNPDNTNYNARSWVLATNNLTLTEQIGTNGNYQSTVVVIPSLTVQDGTTNTWMRPDNDNVVWVYRRRTAAYGETNLLGKAIWHPIEAVRWIKKPMSVHF